MDSTAAPCLEFCAYLSRLGRADERTRTAFLNSLRVITQALRGCAEACKSRISRRLSVLRIAECCTVLRSRWYQSGINITLYPSYTVLHLKFLYPHRASLTSCD